jgi:predicted short-subunit dehydrogenase-like oxidoreductase (DUF2520 family)
MKNHCDIKQIACFGSGGVAWSLLSALYEAGYGITQVFSPHLENAVALAVQVNAKAIDSTDQYRSGADLVILAIPDDAVAATLPLFENDNALIVHTAGALPLQVFDNHHIANYGVLYPLQTFTRKRRIDMAEVPILIETNTDANTERLFLLSKSILCNPYQITSAQRLRLHLAAVFACNFTNHCLSIAADILQQSGIAPDILHTLIRETINKALSATHPQDVQTGPALRGDYHTMQKHLTLLQNNPLYANLYQMLSDSIQSAK